ncbi:MAG: aminodeoxychorismate/anthranilate synthase component II [Bacteroidales bacterium]|jgi:anthranilate synthase component 2|nr:aminodeoxychorismate/anthranilate synthase component II [Bacteroidales bacterium]NLM92366.1 aminodeoxychorismate/anthranilate synthase component II [Bacteroidales bacterium]
MKILILDNYDSFTYNLFHIVEDLLGNKDILEVFRNDQISLDAVGAYNKIIISPGPGLPEEAGIITELIRRYADKKSILGVCLGHQAITEVFGGKLKNLDEVLHGVAIPTRVVKTDALLFSNCPELFETGRYHSWVPDKKSFPHCLEITAIDPSGNIMGLQHKTLDVHGVQFHPESVLTKVGRQILKNWVLG